jgi:hypothetical protein
MTVGESGPTANAPKMGSTNTLNPTTIGTSASVIDPSDPSIPSDNNNDNNNEFDQFVDLNELMELK